MSDTLNCNKCVQSPINTTEIKDDISVMEAKSDYRRNNIFKWFLLYLFMGIILCIAACFLWKFFTVEAIQRYIFDQIMNNIIFIALSVFAILKINVPNIKK